MSQEQIYIKAWIDNSVRDKTIQCYSEDDISIDRRSVGHGGYGVVYKATVKGTGQQIAMKTSFPDQYGTEQDFYKRFVKEVAIASFYCVLVTVEWAYSGHVTKFTSLISCKTIRKLVPTRTSFNF